MTGVSADIISAFIVSWQSGRVILGELCNRTLVLEVERNGTKKNRSVNVMPTHIPQWVHSSQGKTASERSQRLGETHAQTLGGKVVRGLLGLCGPWDIEAKPNFAPGRFHSITRQADWRRRGNLSTRMRPQVGCDTRRSENCRNNRLTVGHLGRRWYGHPAATEPAAPKFENPR